MDRVCRCGGVIRQQGKPYWDILPSCTCANPVMVRQPSTAYSTSSTTTNPPKEEDTPKEAANELEEKERLTQDIYKAMQVHWLSERHDAILSLIESEKVKAVEEYKKRLVGGLEELQFSYGSDGNSMLLDAIKLVEETD